VTVRSESPQHDHAFATAAAVLALFAPLLREEEHRDAFREIYTRVKAGIERYETQADRTHRQLEPGAN
jgi:hypothetical protein